MQHPCSTASPLSRPIVLLAMTVGIVACGDRSEPPLIDQSIRPARIMTVEGGIVNQQYEFAGRIEAAQSIDVSFEVSGPLVELPIKEGQTIAEGALVAALDPTDFELAVREAEVQLQLSEQDLSRKRQILAENGIAKSTVDDAQSEYELQLVRLRRAQEGLLDSKIYAPFEAYVARRYLDNRVNIRPSDPVARLLDLNELLVVISVPENLVATIKREQIVASWVEFSFAEGEKFPVEYRENRGEASDVAQTYEVTFSMPRPQNWTVLPGMTATVTLQQQANTDTQILLPSSALVATPNNEIAVWVYEPGDQSVTRRVVETGPPGQAGVPVLSGLEEGQQIVTVGAGQLQAGMRVRPMQNP